MTMLIKTSTKNRNIAIFVFLFRILLYTFIHVKKHLEWTEIYCEE